jgi:hypothetical protein
VVQVLRSSAVRVDGRCLAPDDDLAGQHEHVQLRGAVERNVVAVSSAGGSASVASVEPGRRMLSGKNWA